MSSFSPATQYALNELNVSGEGDSDKVHVGLRRVWQMIGATDSVPGLPAIEAIYENPAAFGGGETFLAPYNAPHPRNPRAILDRYQIQRQTQKTYLIIGLYSSDRRWRYRDPPDLADEQSLFDYDSDYVRTPLPLALLEKVNIPVLLTPLKIGWIWQPDERGFERPGQTQAHWKMRRNEIILTPADRNIIQDQQNHIHRLNFDGRIGYYKFTANFRQRRDNIYDIEYEWIGDVGIRDLDVGVTVQKIKDFATGDEFDAIAWPGKGDTKVEWEDTGLWAIPPFHTALPIAPTPLFDGLNPDENPPQFTVIPMYEHDFTGWAGLPGLP